LLLRGCRRRHLCRSTLFPSLLCRSPCFAPSLYLVHCQAWIRVFFQQEPGHTFILRGHVLYAI
jgi:hypothetical protein